MAGLNEAGKVVVWDRSDVSQAFRIESADRKIKAVRFKPDDDVLAVGYTDGYFELWDISSREVISEFKAHSSGVNDIRF
jgi:WD40 repeat protein